MNALTLIACSTASPDVPPPRPETMSVLMSDLPTDRASFVDWNILMYTQTGATDPRPDVDWIRRRAERTWTQGWTHGGVSPPPARRDQRRRTASRFSHPSRFPSRSFTVTPIRSSRSRTAHELAAAIPGARLTIVPGMGHDLPPVFWPVVFDAVGRPR